jgi:two-component system OmpR family sensor kinase
LQVLSAELLGTRQSDRANRLVGQAKALGNLTEKLLQFSRTGGVLALHREPIAVLPVLQILINDFRRLDGVGDRLRLTMRNTEELVALTDLDALGIALRNLLENSVRYGALDEPIDVIIEPDYRIRVVNGDAVVAAELLAEVRLPFRRGTSVGLGGGLGLAIVDNIMSQLEGSLHLSSPPAGCLTGFEAMLVFPSPPPNPAAVPRHGAKSREGTLTLSEV